MEVCSVAGFTSAQSPHNYRHIRESKTGILDEYEYNSNQKYAIINTFQNSDKRENF